MWTFTRSLEPLVVRNAINRCKLCKSNLTAFQKFHHGCYEKFIRVRNCDEDPSRQINLHLGISKKMAPRFYKLVHFDAVGTNELEIDRDASNGRASANYL